MKCQVMGTRPKSLSPRCTPRAFQTLSEASTISSLQGLAHSSMTVATVDFPRALIFNLRKQLELWSKVAGGRATQWSLLEWKWPSQADGPPPSPPFSKLLTVIVPCFSLAPVHVIIIIIIITQQMKNTSFTFNPPILISSSLLSELLLAVCWPPKSYASLNMCKKVIFNIVPRKALFILYISTSLITIFAFSIDLKGLVLGK